MPSVMSRFNCAAGDHDWVPVPVPKDDGEDGWMEWECVVCGEPAPDGIQTDLDADYPEALWE